MSVGAKHRSRISALLVIALAITWVNGGCNFLAFKVGVDALPAVDLAAIRFTTAGLVLAPVALWQAHASGLPSRSQFAAAGLIGATMLIGGQTLTLWGVKYLPAGIASVFGSSPPLFLALFAWLVFRRPLRKLQLAGVCIGFTGLAFTALISGSASGFRPIGAIAVLAASAIWAAGSLLQQRVGLPENRTVNLTVQLLTAGLLLGAFAWTTGAFKHLDLARLPHGAWAAIAFLTFFSSIVGYGLFTWLNATASSTLANTYNYVSPVIAIGLAAIFLGEPVSWSKAAAASVALVGVALMLYERPQAADEPDRETRADSTISRRGA